MRFFSLELDRAVPGAVVLSLVALVGCGGCGPSTATDPLTAAETALQAGRSDEAVRLIRAHIARLTAATPEHHEATLLLCSALAEEHPSDARDALLKLAAEHPTLVTPRDFKQVQSYLQTHEHYSVAVDVMDAGLKRWSDDPIMLEVKDVLRARILQVGDNDAIEKMRGLGYI